MGTCGTGTVPNANRSKQEVNTKVEFQSQNLSIYACTHKGSMHDVVWIQ